MITPNEHLRPQEMSRAEEEAQDIFPHTRLTRARAEQLFKQREKMLSSVKADVGTAFYDALRAKINYENTSLVEIIESDARIMDVRKRLNKVLKSEYFVQKFLDKNIL